MTTPMKWIMTAGLVLLAGGALVARADHDPELETARAEACAQMEAAGTLATGEAQDCQSDNAIFLEAADQIVEREIPKSFREINLAILRFDADNASREWRGARPISLEAFSRSHDPMPYGKRDANADLDHRILEISSLSVMSKSAGDDHATLFFEDADPESRQMLPVAGDLEARLYQSDIEVSLTALCLAIRDTNGGCKARTLIRLSTDPVFQTRIPVATRMQFRPLTRPQIRKFLRMTYVPRFSADSRDMDIFKMRNLTQIAQSHAAKS